jgi:hypothetical protein
LDQAKKARDVESKYGEGDWSKNRIKQLDTEIAELEKHVSENISPAEVKAYNDAKAARAAEAKAKSSAVGPEGVLAEQQATKDMEAQIKKSVDEQAARESEYIKSAASVETKTAPKTSRAKKVAEPAPDDEMFTPEQTFEPVIKKSSSGISLSSVKPVTTPKTGRVKKTTQPVVKVKAATKKQAEAKLAKRMEYQPIDTDVEATAAVEEFVKKKKRHDKSGNPLRLTVGRPKSGKI